MHNLGLIADADMELATGPGESWIKVMAITNWYHSRQ